MQSVVMVRGVTEHQRMDGKHVTAEGGRCQGEGEATLQRRHGCKGHVEGSVSWLKQAWVSGCQPAIKHYQRTARTAVQSYTTTGVGGPQSASSLS